MNSLQKYYLDIAVTMTGFGFIKLIAHFFRYLDSQKKCEFQVIPNIKDSEFEEIKCSYISLWKYDSLNLYIHLISSKSEPLNFGITWNSHFFLAV